jgi:hypothetical protein
MGLRITTIPDGPCDLKTGQAYEFLVGLFGKDNDVSKDSVVSALMRNYKLTSVQAEKQLKELRNRGAIYVSKWEPKPWK